MAQSFAADVDRIIIATEKRMIALTRASIQDVIDDAQLPSGKGGRMRVDTGFLRASGQASLSGLPTGPVRGDASAKPGQYDTDSANVILTLADLQLGAVFYFGWTANYAKYREAYDGFLGAAVQNWKGYVAKNTEIIRQRISK